MHIDLLQNSQKYRSFAAVKIIQYIQHILDELNGSKCTKLKFGGFNITIVHAAVIIITHVHISVRVLSIVASFSYRHQSSIMRNHG